MARNIREIVQDADYHIIARINRNEKLFVSKPAKVLMMDVLAKAKKRYSFEINHFCIMTTHIHLLIKPDDANELPRIMQWILSVFAVAYNKMYGLHGHLWYDRYKSIVITQEDLFALVYHYISNNPVKAGMVVNPLDYEFCGDYHVHNKITSLLDPFKYKDQFY